MISVLVPFVRPVATVWRPVEPSSFWTLTTSFRPSRWIAALGTRSTFCAWSTMIVTEAFMPGTGCALAVAAAPGVACAWD